MRKIFFVIIATFFAFAACEKDNKTISYTEETVSMGANSASDVYYSFVNGEVKTVNRTDWDIAFSTPMMSATVLINEGAGMELYCTGDANAWESVDTTGLYLKQKRYNDKSGWSIGAFNHYPSGMFNFGWGTYQADHNVYGDSIYIIKLTDRTYRKFFYEKRIGLTATHYLRWANLDGTNQKDTSFAAASYYTTKHFIHYSIVNEKVVEAEPDKNSWDLLFTRYVAQIPTGPHTIINYPVMGVLSNNADITSNTIVTVAKVTGVPAEKSVETDAMAGYSSVADAIGYDWKVSHPVTHEISLVDSTSYFVKSVDGDKYQLYFTNYGGIDAGTITFKVKKVE